MMKGAAEFASILDAMDRFFNGDWGELCQEDKEANDNALTCRAGRVLARYTAPDDDIYINLSFDEPSLHCDVILIMLCNEY